MKSSLSIPIAIALGGIIVAAAVYATTPRNQADSSNPALVRPVGVGDHIYGNPAAPVKIVEYSDFDCSYCKGFDGVLRQVIADSGADGKVAWVFRYFPLVEIHPDAFKDALAAECAAQVGGNDGFWRFTQELFDNQPADPNRFGAYASAAGIPGNAFATCYATASSTLSGRVNADRQNALDMGVTGTPYSVILAPGKAPVAMSGAYPYDAVKALVEQALAQ